jgi:surface protein
MAKLFRNYNTLAEYEADTNKPVNTVCFIKDAKVIYVDGIRYSYKQLDYLPPAISESEALEYMGKIIKNAQEVGLIGIPVPKPVPTIYLAGSDNINISGTYYTAEPDKINIDGVEYYKIKLDKDLNNDFYNFNYNFFTNLIFKDVDTSNVTDMNSMFYNCSSLTSLDLSGWDTSKVTNMGGMFGDCSALTSLDLSGWNTSNVTDMSDMFYDCNALKTIRMVGCSQTTINKIKAQLSRDGITGCTILTE